MQNEEALTLDRRSITSPQNIKAATSASIVARKQRAVDRWNTPGEEHNWLFSKCEGDPEGCWSFTGCKDRLGYGKVRFRGKSFLAHRMAFFITFGYLPEDKLVCHKCDNTSCINPQHLFLGSDYDNTMDAVQKGRKFIPAGGQRWKKTIRN